jgi:dienelactone hydrolase
MTRNLLLCATLLALPALARAAEPRPVSIRAGDGLVLHGTWYPSDRPAGRTVLLLHEMTGNRAAWSPFLGGLRAAGIDALAVDLRGFGETGGKMDWETEVTDARAWFEWMRTRPGVAAGRVGIMGSSLGAKLALIVCSRDTGCAAAVALSPYGIFAPAEVDFRDRAVFLVGTRGDDVHSAIAVRRMASDVQGDVTIRLVAGSEPGIPTLMDDGANMVPEVVRWLDHHL